MLCNLAGIEIPRIMEGAIFSSGSPDMAGKPPGRLKPGSFVFIQVKARISGP